MKIKITYPDGRVEIFEGRKFACFLTEDDFVPPPPEQRDIYIGGCYEGDISIEELDD